MDSTHVLRPFFVLLLPKVGATEIARHSLIEVVCFEHATFKVSTHMNAYCQDDILYDSLFHWPKGLFITNHVVVDSNLLPTLPHLDSSHCMSLMQMRLLSGEMCQNTSFKLSSATAQIAFGTHPVVPTFHR